MRTNEKDRTTIIQQQLDFSMSSYDRSDAREGGYSNMAAPAPLASNIKGETDLIFLTGGINQQFVMGRPGITDREQLTGKKIGFVGDGGLNDALVNFIIEKLSADGIGGVKKEPISAGSDEAALISGRS